MDYRRNEDRLCTGSSTGAKYNHIYLVDDISNESGEVAEPVTLQEMKDYLRLEGFHADDDSPGDDFDFDDDLIEDLINEGRVWVEKYTGVHLITKTLQVVLLNQAGMIELPGPITGPVVIEQNEVTVDAGSYEIIGSAFPKLVTPFPDRIVLEYDAGYNLVNCPKGLRNAIKAYVADNYENRGDDDTPNIVFAERAARKARPYRRLPLFG